jgi:hypothetical protein
MAEVEYPLNTNGSEPLAGASVKYSVISRPSGANPFSNSRRTFGSSVSLVCARIDHGRQLVAGWRTRSVDTVPAKPHNPPSSIISASSMRARIAIEMAALAGHSV